MTSRERLNPNDLQALEERCQRMIFEKEDKYVNIETRLK